MKDANRRFAELAGICCDEPRLIIEWPVYYGNELVYTSVDPQDGTEPEVRHYYPNIPDFTDAREVLKVMREREDWLGFLNTVGLYHSGIYAVEVKYLLDTTGKLRDMAIEWMEAER